MAESKDTNAMGISFPLQLVIVITTAVVSVVSSNFATQSSMKSEQAQTRSDVRDIGTRFDLYRDVVKADAAAQRAELTGLRTTIEAAAAAAKAQTSAQDEKINALKSAVEASAASTKLSFDAINRRQDFQAIQISNFQDALAKLSQRKE